MGNFGHRWQTFGRLFMATVLVLAGLHLLLSLASPMPVQSQPTQTSPTGLMRQGQQIVIEGKTFNVAWGQWQEGGELHTGLSDTGAMQTLGLELLDNEAPTHQMVQWFTRDRRNFAIRFVPPYRYLDLTPLWQSPGQLPQVQGNKLILPATGSEILTMREGRHAWGKRVVLELSQPAYWQVSQAKTEAVVMVNAFDPQGLGRQNGEPTRRSPTVSPIDDDDLGGTGAGNTIRHWLDTAGGLSKVHFQLPAGYRLAVSTLANPYRLVIDARTDAPKARTIKWSNGITWQQTSVNVGRGEQFPVTVLAINPRSPEISLRPIMTNPQQAQGTAPLLTLARNQQVSAAINGGFFNRNTQLPLGAIRTNQAWVSGPILNRGAIAWNDQGEFKLGRLALTETVITSTGKRLAINYLNSGYVQKGLARYTPTWGKAYTPLTDNETVYVVQHNQITGQYPLGKAGQLPRSIPMDGYLIIDRGNQISPTIFPIGSTATLTGGPLPAEFDRFPHSLAAGPLLIDQGRIVLNAEAEKFSKAFQQQQASRSAIALDQSGNLLLVAAHNRVGGRGASLNEFALILKQLGAVGALNLDGGSSTALSLGGQLLDRSPVTAAKVSNALGVFVR